MSPPSTRVDHSALRTNQAFIIGLTVVAFILDFQPLAAAVGFVMLVGSLVGRPGFLFAYLGLNQMGLVTADIIIDHPQPHRFAQTVGGLFLAGSTIAWLVGAITLGWILAWVVIALAALNLFGGFCVGCAAYYWLHRLGLPGFGQSPPPGVTPGRRPAADSWEGGNA